MNKLPRWRFLRSCPSMTITSLVRRTPLKAQMLAEFYATLPRKQAGRPVVAA